VVYFYDGGSQVSWLVLTNASPGATRNYGTNGDLCTLLDWALPQASWGIEYSSGNARVYRPSIGLRNRLHVNHDSATSGNAGLATVRGCESASSATTLVDPFPLVAQTANNLSTWNISNSTSTTDRPFRIYLSETFVFYFSNYSGGADVWDMGFFGDAEGVLSSDVYNTVVSVRNNNAATTSAGLTQTMAASGNAGNNIFWARDITGATKSSRGILYGSGTTLSNVANTPVARGGYQNRIYREKIGLSDAASITTTASVLQLIKRGWLPNAWNPLHTGRGSVSDIDTFTDTAYDATASFRGATTVSANWIIMEETDTWSPP